MTDVQVRPARSPEDLDAVRRLCWAYRDVLLERTADHPALLDYYYAFPTYQKLVDELPGKHVPPDGDIFVAAQDDMIIGCGMTHRIDADTCEIKRVYVAPSGRGKGVAQALCTTAMNAARQAGYKRMVLDTMVTLPEAMSLYENMGFTNTMAYHDLPTPFTGLVVFYEHPL